MTTARMITPEMKAAGRQPAPSTRNPMSGAMTVPPMAVPVPAMPMARPRCRRNHWLMAGMVALLYPARNPSESSPTKMITK